MVIVSEIIKKLQESIGRQVIVFKKNNFRYEGYIRAVDDKFLVIFDIREKKTKFISLDSIEDIEVGDKNEEEV